MSVVAPWWRTPGFLLLPTALKSELWLGSDRASDFRGG